MTNLLWPQVHYVHVGRVMAENLQCKMCWWVVIDLSLLWVIPWVFPLNRFLNVNYPVYLQMVSQCVCVTKKYVYIYLHTYLSKCLHEKMHTSCLSTLYVICHKIFARSIELYREWCSPPFLSM